jgi:hypothetical protein
MSERVDEISVYYDSARRVEDISFYVFITMTVLSLTIPNLSLLSAYINAETINTVYNILQYFFLLLIVLSFGLEISVTYFLVPNAEKMRRKQLLSDAFGTPLITETTKKYYNNNYSPGYLRLGANVFENALFSEQICKFMLKRKRTYTGIIFFVWLAVVFYRYSNFDLMLWITQLLFSSRIIAPLISLELLKSRVKNVYDNLYNHFLQNKDSQSPESISFILNEFASYESAKASSGIILSSDIFFKYNDDLTKKWEDIKTKLQMS